MGLRFSALSESFERVWRVFGEKMREIRVFKGQICDFPDIYRDQQVFWSRSTCLLDGAWRIFRVWSRAISDPARDPLKKISPLTSPWSRAKFVKARDPLKISSSLTWCWSRAKIMKDCDPLKKNCFSDFTLIASKNRADRDPLKNFCSLTCPWSRSK